MTPRKTLLVSILAAIVGVVALRAYMHRFEQAAMGGPPLRVLVWRQDAGAGSVIGRELLGVGTIPRAYFESRHVSAQELDVLPGTRLAAAVRAGETVTWTDLASTRRTERPLAELVPAGMRAFRLDPSAGPLDDLLRPGDRVDVVHVRASDGRANALLERVLVLAVGDDTTFERDERRHARTARATLAVRPDQARTLAEAEQVGVLRLVLRHPADLEVSEASSGPVATTLETSRAR